MKLVELRHGEALYEMDDPVRWVYLPETGLLSVISVMVSGASVETSVIGREGGIGFVEALGSGKIFSRVIVQVAGTAYRVSATHYRDAFNESASMRKAVHQQVELLLAEARQAIACQGAHKVQPRLCRWLLECRDLAGGLDVLPLTQEFLAVMLGVQRTSVGQVGQALQDKGLIKYSRGRIEILDPAGLERDACECRATVQQLRAELEPASVLPDGRLRPSTPSSAHPR